MTKILIGRSDVDLDYPVCRPSLDLDFTQEELDPRITFTRGSIGTRVNRNRVIETVDANQPRFDYDPVTGECKGLLIEESRQNLIQYSEDFSNAYWNKTRTTISSNVTATTAPDGSNNADKLIEDTQSNLAHHLNRTNISFTSGVTYTLSGYYKSAERKRIALQFGNNQASNVFPTSTNYRATFDLSNGTIVSSGSSVLSSNIISIGNGWYRCSISATAQATGTEQIFVPFIVQSGSTTSYSGDGTSGIYIWGAQLEAGAFPTSYIPTTTATVTRSADLASMTGTNFSSWYNSSEGTLYANAKSTTNSVLPTGIASLNNSSSPTTNRVDLRYYQSGNSQTFFNGVNGGGSSLPRTSGFSLTNPKFAVSYATQNINFCVNSSLISSRTSAFVPSPLINTLRIGTFDSGVNFYLNGTISRLTYYPRRLKDNQFQYLTQ